MGGRGSGAIRNLGTITAPSDKAFSSWKEGEEWLQKNLGYTEKEALDLSAAMEHWSNYGSKAIHENSTEKGYSWPVIKTGAEYAEVLDKYINDPRLKKTEGPLYRGLSVKRMSWSEADVANLERQLNSGTWKEPGITAFSSDRKIAESYTGTNISASGIGVIVEMRGNKHAVPIGHLSIGGGERESLYPSSIRKKGLKIVSWSRKPTGIYQRGKNAGKPLGYIYTVVVEDR